MQKYIITRFLQTIPVLFFGSVLVFLILHLTPGDPIKVLAGPQSKPEDIARVRARYGLDQPLPVQYFRWAEQILRGDLGRSMRTSQPVTEIIWDRLFNTLRLTVTSIAFAVAIGLLLGILAGVNRNSIFDNLSMMIAVGGFSIPPFWLGLLLMLIFSVKLGLLPAGGGDSAKHIVLPSIALGLSAMGFIARMTRTTVLEVMGEDYIRTARAKGMVERRVVFIHALKNALIPVVTVIGLQFGILMAGAIVTETIFTWPGIGWLLVQAILKRDFPVVQAALLIITATLIAVNLIVDIMYTFLDPRIKLD